MFLKGNISIINSPFNKKKSINHYSNFPEPIIPSFQYSSIPIGAKPLSSKKELKISGILMHCVKNRW
jgi:hypothetical protein